ncbi:FabD/lysophospholipase-like protein [Patellaria atrata CBS 101060]|uniref:FabD/lysophospholipase-like protein n=1 Tax=Patellaria atrata CBS 101060 TaxID=1346257 RepID=A0A9P4SD64_9PEZI|nr:FabD/lysophospholipase-like protein [Patellaria atrata CBS 101060]
MLTQKTASARPKHGKELCLLSLDGGGVRGFSTLCIIEEMMRKIDPLNPPKPCDYFDMIGGTSTGGLIAVMLGRLKMTVEECREAYRELADEVFQPMNHLIAPAWTPFWRWRFNARFDTEALERSIKKIIFEQLKKDTLFQEDNPTCKVFVTATSAYLPDRTTILANYESSRFPRALFDCTKIWEACRATSAASTFFEPIDIGPDKQRFVDGATGANNPVVEVWSEAREAFKLGRELEDNVMCLVSLGTGIPTVEAFGETFVEVGRTLKAMATETETTAEKFLREHTNLDTEHRYFRFNVKTGLEKIGLENAAMRPQIVAATDRYVSSETVRKELEHCADTLRLRDCLLNPDFT